MAHVSDKGSPVQLSDALLDPTTAALLLVLQQPIDIDPCSLACIAVTCNTYSHAVLARFQKWSLCCNTPKRLDSFTKWFGQHSSSLSNLTQCFIAFVGDRGDRPHLGSLPCPGLRQLHLKRLRVQLGRADGSPGVLHGCLRLTALHLDSCRIMQSATKAAAAIAALSGLQSLSLADTASAQNRGNLFAVLKYPAQLTHLSLSTGYDTAAEFSEFRLKQLSSLDNLGRLELAPSRYHPIGGRLAARGEQILPSQLSKLTCLRVGQASGYDDLDAQQLQHLSSLTALRHLAIKGGQLTLSQVTDIQHLVQLTALEFDCARLHLGYTSTADWTCLKDLQSLSMRGGSLRPRALSRCTGLRALCLEGVQYCAPHTGRQLEKLLMMLPQLLLLTQLSLTISSKDLGVAGPPPADAFTALVASTNLCSLRLGVEVASNTPEQWVLFAPGVAYPHLRVINLAQLADAQNVPIGEQQLQQLCGCCPTVQDLTFAMCGDASSTALQPLLQLSALTQLVVHRVGAAAAGVFRVAAQLAGLKRLELRDIALLADPTLLHLTALTGLKELSLWQQDMLQIWGFAHEERWGKANAVWLQLLRRLLRDATCCRSLRKRKR